MQVIVIVSLSGTTSFASKQLNKKQRKYILIAGRFDFDLI